MVLVRRELAPDVPAAQRVHAEAFPQGERVEAPLAAALRAGGWTVPALTLVAERDGRVVGSLVTSTGRVGDRLVVALGPVGVLPDHQGHRIGAALLLAVLGGADALGEPVVVLLGDPGFYGRFGFEPAGPLGVLAPVPAWGEDFQLRRLTRWDPSLRGAFRYAAPFDEL